MAIQMIITARITMIVIWLLARTIMFVLKFKIK